MSPWNTVGVFRFVVLRGSTVVTRTAVRFICIKRPSDPITTETITRRCSLKLRVTLFSKSFLGGWWEVSVDKVRNLKLRGDIRSHSLTSYTLTKSCLK